MRRRGVARRAARASTPAPLPGAPADATFVDVDGVHVRYRELGSGPGGRAAPRLRRVARRWVGVMPASPRTTSRDRGRPQGLRLDEPARGRLQPGRAGAAGVARARQARRRRRRDRRALVGHARSRCRWRSRSPARVRRVALYDAYVYDDQVPSFFRWAQKPGARRDAVRAVLHGADRRPRAARVLRRALGHAGARRARRSAISIGRARPPRRSRPRAATTSRRCTSSCAGSRGRCCCCGARRSGHAAARSASGSRNELADARLKVYPRCGHIPMVEARNAIDARPRRVPGRWKTAAADPGADAGGATRTGMAGRRAGEPIAAIAVALLCLGAAAVAWADGSAVAPAGRRERCRTAEGAADAAAPVAAAAPQQRGPFGPPPVEPTSCCRSARISRRSATS